uniref:Reverse transcriptase domain-containing protein n=1 Tax=Tanacetum cinerariifolium TaxID=118510 RepID=A0A6L2NEK6_TANCI|nr:reverse transcriptase domain-containing protein [Tanacetum cinerariifolium]
MSSERNNIKLAIRNDKSKIICGCFKHMIGNIKLLINFVWKFLGTVRFKNDHIAAILGYGDLKWRNITITRVYFVEGLGHNIFSVSQLCDDDLEVAFRRNSCFFSDLDGVDLLKGNRSINLYTINLYDMASASPICLMARATPTKSWLWNQRLSHLNFDIINDLAKNDLVCGLPKFKYAKGHLCPSCKQGKSKRASHPPKPVSNSKQRLHLLHMDLCGPMRVASINGKRYVLVIVDDYFRYTWVHFLRTKDETPKQNGVVERRNCTLVEAARTMLIFSHALLFLWAEAIATACYTQKRSIIHRRFNKTPYELIQGRKSYISYLYVFRALCYPKNDHEDIGKLGAKAMAFEQNCSKPGLQSLTSGQISFGLGLTYVPSTIAPMAPTEGYEDAIVVLAITADNFKLKHGLLTLVQNKQFYGHDKKDPHAHIRYFNKITSTLKFPNVSNTLIKLMLFPFSLEDQDSLNSDSRGNFLDKMPRECLSIIESKSKVRYSRDQPVVGKVSTNASTFGVSPDVAELKDMVKALLFDKKNRFIPNQNQGNNFNQGPVYQLPVFQQPAYQAPAYQAPAPQTQGVSKEDFSAYVKANDAVKKNMQTQGQNMQNQLTNLIDLIMKFVNSNSASTSSLGTLPSNTIANPKGDLKAITTRSGVSYDGPQILPLVMENEPEATKDTMNPTNNENTKDVQPQPVQFESPISISKPAIAPVSASNPNPKASIPYPSRRNDERNREKASNQIEKFYQIFKDMSFEISFADALILMPKFASTLTSIVRKKEKLSEMARTLLNEHCYTVLLKKLPKNLGDPGKFLTPCDFPGMAECLALADLSASINMMPFSMWKRLCLPDLTPTCMTLELANRSISRPVKVEEDVYVKVGSFHFSAYFVVVDFDADPRVSLILERSFLKTGRALIDVFEGELTLRVGKEAITFNLDQTSRNYLPEVRKELKICEAKTGKSSVDEPPVVELKVLPSHLEYEFLEGDDKLLVIVAKDLSVEEKAALLTVLKSHKRAIAWKLFDINVKEGIVLGHKISKQRIEVDKAKVDVISKLPHLTNVKGIRSFLGHASFYRRFIKYFSKIARPMTKLIEKDTPFIFSQECVDTFETLKRKLTEAPILIAPDWDMPFELMCDASDFAIGAVLGQRQDKHFRPIHYASKTMTEAESNYTTTEKEMLAVVYAFEKFRSYLILNKSIVYTDHSALKYLFTKKDAKAGLLRSDGFYFYRNSLSKWLILKEQKTWPHIICVYLVRKPLISLRLATLDQPDVIMDQFTQPKRAVGENRASWSDKLDDALWAFCTAYKTPIGYTPYKMLYEKLVIFLLNWSTKPTGPSNIIPRNVKTLAKGFCTQVFIFAASIGNHPRWENDPGKLSVAPDSLRVSAQMVATVKLLVLNPNEFELWKMRIKQYFLMTDYSLWEVILNGDLPPPTRSVDGVETPYPPTTVEDKLARKIELKARGLQTFPAIDQAVCQLGSQSWPFFLARNSWVSTFLRKGCSGGGKGLLPRGFEAFITRKKVENMAE